MEQKEVTSQNISMEMDGTQTQGSRHYATPKNMKRQYLIYDVVNMNYTHSDGNMKGNDREEYVEGLNEKAIAHKRMLLAALCGTSKKALMSSMS